MYEQHNIEELYALIGSLPGQEFSRGAHIDFIKTSHSIWPNQLINLRATQSELDGLLDDLENKVESGQLPSIYMGNPSADEPSILEGLNSRGYKTGQWTAMSHDLEIIQKIPTAPGIEIKAISSIEEMAVFIRIVETELMGGAEINHQIFNTLLNHSSCHFFLAYEQNLAVGCGLLFIGSDSGGIYIVATAASHRKKGIGSLITNTCLKKAKELKCKKVDLQATALGKSVYAALGFKVFGDIPVFKIGKG